MLRVGVEVVDHLIITFKQLMQHINFHHLIKTEKEKHLRLLVVVVVLVHFNTTKVLTTTKTTTTTKTRTTKTVMNPNRSKHVSN